MIGLREDAAKVFFLGVEVYAFGLYVALGLALAMIALTLLLRKGKWKGGTAPLTGILAIGIGFLVSRLFFGVMEGAMGQMLPPWAMLRFETGGYSMMGALLGACAGGILSARLTGQNRARMLDLLAPCLLLFIACERLGEGYIEDYGVSRISDIMRDSPLRGTFLAVEDRFGVRLATYLPESFTALVLAIVMLRDLDDCRRPGDTYLKFLLLFGATQILMESLRYDGHMTVKAFVRLEMIIAMLLLSSALIVLAIRRWKERRGLALAALISIPAVAGLGVMLEFMIDHAGVSHYLLYLTFILILAAPVWLGLRLRKETKHG